MNKEEIQRVKELIYSGYFEGFILPCGIIYFGGLYQGLPNGTGSIILPNGNTYKYKFRNGKLADGRAIIVYPDGSFYEGEVSRDNKPYGQGIIRNLDGSTYYQGNWSHSHDPKIIWRCNLIWWYENGDIFRINPYPNPYVLHPAVCLEIPSSDTSPAHVMFPHLQELGCPMSENNFLVGIWDETPERAVQSLGYRNLRDYLEWVYEPDRKILERIETTIEVAKWGMKIFGLLPQGHDHKVVRQGVGLGLAGLKYLIGQQKKKYL
ncbi:MAG: hypothetical protein SWX82_27240 [Cyanobacteriota bacterium]|nr:hypothetical protein [Cyanobacteriota bacterium]